MYARTFTRMTTIALTGAALAVIPSSATGAGPVGGCPAPYELSAITDAPPAVQPALTALDQKGNGDGYLCRLPFPGNSASVIGQPYNVIDNHAVGR
jgi:hypothetical protein